MPENPMTHRARGAFTVQMTPAVAGSAGEEPTLGRMLLDKTFSGELEAVSKGHFLSARTAVADSAGYVALECVRGRLQGRNGSFVLQHSGTMRRGASSLTVTVVPDSGTDQLTGLIGTMAIDMSGGAHAYTFDYSLPGQT